MKQTLFASATILSGNCYWNPLVPATSTNWGTSEAGKLCPIRVAGTLRNLQIWVATACVGTETRTFTLRKNGADTALAFTMTAASGNTASDAAHDIAIAAGDEVSLHMVSFNSPPSCAAHIRLEFESTAANTSIYGFGAGPTQLGSATTWHAIIGGQDSVDPLGSMALTSQLVTVAGTFTTLDVKLTTAPGAGKSRAFVVFKNGTAQDGTGGTPDTTITVSDAATSGTATFSLSVVAGDLIVMRSVPAGSPAQAGLLGSCSFVSTGADQRHITMASSDAMDQTATEYNVAHGYGIVWGNDTAFVEQRGGINPFTLGSLRADTSKAPGLGNAIAFTVMKNGAPTALTVTVGGTATSAVYVGGDTVAIADGDTFNVRAVKTGTPTGVAAKLTFFQTAPAINNAFVVGTNTSVAGVSNAFAVGLDGNTNILATEGLMKVFGDFEVTGTTTIAGYATETGLRTRTSVRAATTADITIATALNNGDSLDGVTLATGDQVLVKNQAAPEQNGVYVVSGSPARSSQYASYDAHAGALLTVQEGTANHDTLWLCTSDVGGTLNTDAIDFTEFTGSGGGALDDLTDVTIAAPSLGQALKYDGAGWVNGTIGGGTGAVIDVVGQTDIVNTAAETTLYSLSIPGNTLGILRLTLAADYLNNSAGTRTFTLRIKYGATTLYDDATTTIGAVATRRNVFLTVLLGNASSTSDQFCMGSLGWGSGATTAGLGDLATSPGALQGYGPVLSGTSAEDSTATKTFTVTIQHSTNHASLSFRRQWAVLEALS